MRVLPGHICSIVTAEKISEILSILNKILFRIRIQEAK